MYNYVHFSALEILQAGAVKGLTNNGLLAVSFRSYGVTRSGRDVMEIGLYQCLECVCLGAGGWGGGGEFGRVGGVACQSNLQAWDLNCLHGNLFSSVSKVGVQRT